MLKELDIVKTNKRISENVPEGTKGVVHQVYPNYPNLYLVEFVNDDNNTIDILEVSENDILIIWNSDNTGNAPCYP
jgi:hypothetical protein